MSAELQPEDWEGFEEALQKWRGAKVKIIAIVPPDEDFPHDFVVLPAGMDLDEEKKKWVDWYATEYLADRDSRRFIRFVDWILNKGARRATPDEITVWEDL